MNIPEQSLRSFSGGADRTATTRVRFLRCPRWCGSRISRQKRLARGLALVTMAAVALATPRCASAAHLSPGFPTPDFGAGDLWTQSYSYQVTAQTLSGGMKDSHADSQQFHPDALPGFLPVPVTTANISGTLGPPSHASWDAIASVAGSIAPGVANAYAHATAVVADANSNAKLVLEILDVLDIGKGGLPNFDLNFGGRTQTNGNNQGTAAYASGTMTTQIYVWPFGAGVPAAGQAFDTAYFKSETIQNLNPVSVYEERNPNYSFSDGSRWWLCARTEVDADAYINDGTGSDYYDQDAIADFEDPIYLRIHPDPSTPDMTFTAASGFDYTSALPEPGGLAELILAGLAFLGGGRRSRRRRGA